MKLTVRQKLLFGGALLILLAVLLTAGFLGVSATNAGEEALRVEARNKLTAIRENKRQQVDDYFNSAAATMRALSGTTTFVEAMRAFNTAAAGLVSELSWSPEAVITNRKRLETYYTNDFTAEFAKRNPSGAPDMAAVAAKLDLTTVAMQHLYVSANPNPLGEKNKLAVVPEASSYGTSHALYHPGIESLRASLGYYDVFLVNNAGRVVYTAFKELDFGTSLVDGVAAKTGLGQTWSKLQDAKPGDIAISDYAEYVISYNDQASFLGTPIFEGQRRLGTLLIQVPLDQITRVMTSNKRWPEVGLGKTGESYLVGDDALMRTDSRQIIENKADFLNASKGGLSPAALTMMEKKNTSIGLIKVDSTGAKRALAGETGFADYTGYRGNAVLGAYAPFPLLGLKWAIIAEIDTAEALAPARELRNRIIQVALIGGLIALSLGGLGVFTAGTRFLRPIEKLSATVRKVSAGDFTARTNLTQGDEIGQLGRQFDTLLDERIAQLAQSQRENDKLNESIVQLLEAVFRLSQRDLTVKVPVREDITGSLADAINALSSETASVMGDVVETANNVEGASNRVKEQADGVLMVAAQEREEVARATDALQLASLAMQQIADRAKRCNTAADRAVTATAAALVTVQSTVGGMDGIRETIRETEKRMKRLSERSQEISTIVSLINSISERTHVLAINANMQAAMAGEAGRGFAVVASEVQGLAENARLATAQISQLVSNIQLETADTIATMNDAVSQVVEGSKLARQAGEQMNQTQAATSNLVELVGEIDVSAQQQAQMSQDLVRRADNIRESTEKTGSQLMAQAQETRTLLDYAEKLRVAVGVFTLPSK
jgi:methyl-accepting chemotaxis protein